MEICTEISLQLPTALGWARAGPANLPSLVQKHQCPTKEQPAFPQASRGRGEQVLGVWKRCSASAKGWSNSLQGAQKQDTEDEYDRPSREPGQTTLAALGVKEGLSYLEERGSHYTERSMYRGEVTFPEWEAESLEPQGTGQHLNFGQEGPWQHDTLGQPGPAARSPQPEALTPTDNWQAPGGGAWEGGTGRRAGVTPCPKRLPPASSLPRLDLNSWIA